MILIYVFWHTRITSFEYGTLAKNQSKIALKFISKFYTISPQHLTYNIRKRLLRFKIIVKMKLLGYRDIEWHPRKIGIRWLNGFYTVLLKNIVEITKGKVRYWTNSSPVSEFESALKRILPFFQHPKKLSRDLIVSVLYLVINLVPYNVNELWGLKARI